MSDPATNVDRLLELAGAVCDNRASQDDLVELDAALHADETSQRRYLKYCRIHVTLEMELQSHCELQKLQERDNLDSPSLAPWESDVLAAATAPTKPEPSPLFPILGNTIHNTAGYFSSGWPLAYLVATAIFGIGLLIGSHVYMSQPALVARQSSLPSRSVIEPKMEPVGRITGTVDCKWVQSTEYRVQSTALDSRLASLVSLGDSFVLACGLMEITYDTGAKVILQGPVTYEVESAAGGYLSVGKLTAKLENQARDSNPQSPTPNPSPLSTLHSPLFTIKTPTAIVTDLGTEFGVEVSKEGSTTSHVYRGSVRLQMANQNGKTGDDARVLHENESARVENRVTQSGGNRVIVLVASAKPADFVREIPKRTIKLLDLVDVVAGGDGFSRRRNRGIDSTDGRIVDILPIKGAPWPVSDGRYHRVPGLPMVDGIFVPCGRYRPVQVDSAGHVFADCPDTNGETAGVLWAGGAPLIPYPWFVAGVKLEDIDYGAGGHGFFFLHANKGITFDLEAIRRANPGCRLLRFRAVAGNVETVSQNGASVHADFYVLVDGQKRFGRRDFNAYNGAAPIAIPLVENDRFLTLIATDGGDGIQNDWIVFGDPRLVLLVTATEDETNARPK